MNSKAASKKHRSRAYVAFLAVGLLAIAASCSSSHKKAAAPPPVTTVPSTSTTLAPATTTTTPPRVAPLTGLPEASSAQLSAPAVVVKIDNVDAARPQTGLNQADVVYEEEVEGGLTRLGAIFQSTYPALVGPVRSGRLTDEGIADDLAHPVYVFSGTNAIFLPILDSQPLTAVNDDNEGAMFWRVGDNEPHNLFTNVAKDATLSSTHVPPPHLWNFLSTGQTFGGGLATPAAQVSITFPAASVSWAYNPAAHGWLRTQNGTPDVDSTGAQIKSTNLVLMFVSYVTSGTAVGEGGPPTPIPEGILTGSGTVWALDGSSLVKGTWSRPSLTTPAKLVGASGLPIALSPGNTWIELVPVGTTPTVQP